MDTLLIASIAVLQQALDLINNTLTSDNHLVFQSTLIPKSTIGKHLRHALDHFNLLIQSISSDSQLPTLNYDTRQRNTPVESSRAAARAAYEATISKLETLIPAIHLDDPMLLSADTPNTVAVKTSVGRELWFTTLHAVHHWSMIRVICAELKLTVDDNLGFAPSTLKYHGEQTRSNKAKI